MSFQRAYKPFFLILKKTSNLAYSRRLVGSLLGPYCAKQWWWWWWWWWRLRYINLNLRCNYQAKRKNRFEMMPWNKQRQNAAAAAAATAWLVTRECTIVSIFPLQLLIWLKKTSFRIARWRHTFSLRDWNDVRCLWLAVIGRVIVKTLR